MSHIVNYWKFLRCKYDFDVLWDCQNCDKRNILNIVIWFIRAGRGAMRQQNTSPMFYNLVFRIFWHPARICVFMSAQCKFNLCEIQKILSWETESLGVSLEILVNETLKNVEMKASCVALLRPCRRIVSIFYVGRNGVPGAAREQLPGCYDHNNPASDWLDGGDTGLWLADPIILTLTDVLCGVTRDKWHEEHVTYTVKPHAYLELF